MGRRPKLTHLAEREVLATFTRHVAELRDRPYLHHGLRRFHFRIDTDPKTGAVSSAVEDGDPDQLRSFVLAFRKLIAPGEPANLPRAVNVAVQRLPVRHASLRSELETLRASWNHTWNVGFIRMTQRGVSLTPAFCFDLWLNGEFFHSDEEKRAQLEELRRAAVPSVKIQFLWSLRVLVGLALQAADLISAGLSEGAFDFDAAG
jgi:hypothetical protein